MNDEKYLWDRSGPPDLEVVKLEKLLAKYASTHTPMHSRKWLQFCILLAVAAAIVVGVVLLKPQPATSWVIAGRKLHSGEMIRTGASTETIASETFGQVEVDPGSALRIEASQFDLKSGTIHALIWAPPGRFRVNTTAAKAIDLGCKYTLQITDAGTGKLTVDMGWVALDWKNAESFIPAGASCSMRPNKGPGTPAFVDASTTFVNALELFDQTNDEKQLALVLSEARPRDAISLWHLMQRTRGEQRSKTLDRFAALATLPNNITKSQLMNGDVGAIDAAWGALHLGEVDFWRKWKQTLQ